MKFKKTSTSLLTDLEKLAVAWLGFIEGRVLGEPSRSHSVKDRHFWGRVAFADARSCASSGSPSSPQAKGGFMSEPPGFAERAELKKPTWPGSQALPKEVEALHAHQVA